MAANPFSSPHAFESPASREQRISAEIAWHQSPIPALGNPPMRAQSAYFKTRMCVRFLSAFCPKGGNCNFAHSIEELRRPQGSGDGRALFPREDGGARNGQIPRTCSEHSGLSEEQKLHKGNFCRKPYNGEICSNGDRYSFTHVQPGSFQDSSVANQKSLSWKTKICHKWLTFGNCPYGDQCCYAHGDAELRKLGGCHGELLVEKNVDAAAAPTNFTPNLTDDDALSKKRKRVLLEPSSALESQQQIRVLTLKKSNGIYGDWINDID